MNSNGVSAASASVVRFLGVCRNRTIKYDIIIIFANLKVSVLTFKILHESGHRRDQAKDAGSNRNLQLKMVPDANAAAFLGDLLQ